MYTRFTHLNLHHYLLWILYFLFWVFAFKPGDTWSDILINSTLIIVTHAGASYFNIYFLFPNFLKNRNYGMYALAILMTISLAAFIEALALFGLNTLETVDKPDLFSLGFMLNTAMAIIYTVAITMCLKLVKQWYENERLAKDLAKLNMETELKYLKSQINPHFLFNSLNSIYALSLRKSDDTPELVLKLSDILRYILYDGSEKQVSLDKEVTYLRSYLELEKVRHGDRMDLQINIEGNMEVFDIAPMLLIPFVENSFKHGLGKEMAKGFVKVDLKAHDKVIDFAISNSKPKKGGGISNQDGYRGGIGIVNVKKRLNLLYPNKYELNFTEDEDTFKVQLKLFTA